MYGTDLYRIGGVVWLLARSGGFGEFVWTSEDGDVAIGCWLGGGRSFGVDGTFCDVEAAGGGVVLVVDVCCSLVGSLAFDGGGVVVDDEF